MKRHIRFLVASASVAALFLSASLISAQEDNSRPKPAARDYPLLIEGLGGQDANGDQGSTSNLNPDTRPLTGVQNPTLGTSGIRHSYWLPGFQYADTVRSSALNQATSSGWNTTSLVTGNFSLLEAWSRAQLAVNYSGGASLFSISTVGPRRNVRWGQMAAALPRPVFLSPRNPVRFRCRDSSVHPWRRWSSRPSAAGFA